MGYYHERGPEPDGIILACLLIFLCFIIGSVWYEYHNPCLEWGPKYIVRVDPNSGLVTYSQQCLKRTN